MISKDITTQTKQKEDSLLSEKINIVLRKNRTTFAVIGFVVVLTIVVIGVGTYIQNSRLIKSTLALENLELDFDAWGSVEENEKKELEKTIIEKGTQIRASYPKTYAASRSAMILARLYYVRDDLDSAEASYYEAANDNLKSHLAPIALANAASMAEDRGDTEKAIEYLQRVVDDYPDAPIHGKALFSLARILEESRQYDRAIVFYLRLIERTDGTDWTKLAQSRIIQLRTLGMVP
jgi:tetratricopeptide (TPR) repeat protein